MEQILKEWFKKTRIEDVNIEISHRLGNIKNLPRTIVAKFFSFKGKQFVLYVAKMLKRQNIYTNRYFSKETMDIKNGSQ